MSAPRRHKPIGNDKGEAVMSATAAMKPSSSSSTSAGDSTSAVAAGEEKINVFRIPHSRMKELVESHLRTVINIKDFSSAELSEDIDVILQAVYQAMWELKSHEYIENHYIMDRLKARLQARRVYNQLVCNCHEDSKLLSVIRLVEKVYSANNESEREESGRELQAAVQSFLKEFLHHMEEEEEVFQPLLTHHFEPNELADMNEVVLRQHSLFRQKVQREKSLTKAVKRKRDDEVFDGFEFSVQELRFRKSYCQEVEDFCKLPDESSSSNSAMQPPPPKVAKIAKKVDAVKSVIIPKSYADLPPEVIMVVLRYLPPRELLRAAQVCRNWHKWAFQSSLWKSLHPSRWAVGDWTFSTFDKAQAGVVAIDGEDAGRTTQLLDSSAFSSTESLCEDGIVATQDPKASTSKVGNVQRIRMEKQILEGMIVSLLPKIGKGVSDLVLTSTRHATNAQIRDILLLCPNLVRLNLSHTLTSDQAFLDLPALAKLEVLNLEGCPKVNDKLLESVKSSFEGQEKTSRIRTISLSGCMRVTSHGVSMLEIHRETLEELDLSGCYMLDGQTLSDLVRGCERLRPEKLSYCNDIEDGPYPDEANGCMNLECDARFCCKRLKF